MQIVDWNVAFPVFERMPKVVAAWVFGSAQGGQIGNGSDLDIAILIESPLSFEELTDLMGELQDAFHFENIDLVPLTKTSSPILRFEAVSGRLLFCRNAAKRAEFVSLTAREYEESMAMIRRAVKERALITQAV